ncbi:hypothetical protein [Luteimonas mephitis]|jgi:hypothetical protein|uniref:hypothetical protein n=1 Tax=Luteimonas mephitis TaxID=83615 RepID=UPI00047D82E9|nr:hypothetical protein [Luteimonas mephitis]
MHRGILIAALMLFAGSAMAADTGTRVDVDNGFTAQRDNILKELGDGETYSEIDAADREKVKAALARITTTLDQAGGVDQLGEPQKVAVFNDQELVNNILTKAGENSRLVCKRVKKTGSHMSSNQCMTVAARNRAQEESQEMLRRSPPRQMPKEGF